MKNSDELPYILKGAAPTITAIDRIDRAGPKGLNTPHDVLLTTDEDPSIEKKGKCWREKSEDSDWLIIEVEPGNSDSRFYLSFSDAVHFAKEAQRKLSRR